MLCSSISANAQFLSYLDPAAAYNRIILDQNDRGSTYDMIGQYKVIGTPNLYGESWGDVFASDNNSSKKIKFRYNTYSQTIEIMVNEKGQFLKKKMEDIDSFTILATNESYVKSNLLFVRGTILDDTKNNFMQIVSIGKNMNLYKAYFTKLGIVSTNYVQSELRQYDLLHEYYYSCPSSFSGLKKIKLNKNWVRKEFSKYDVNVITDKGFSQNSENFLKEIFLKINE
jgi:hypothetical protein